MTVRVHDYIPEQKLYSIGINVSRFKNQPVIYGQYPTAIQFIHNLKNTRSFIEQKDIFKTQKRA